MRRVESKSLGGASPRERRNRERYDCIQRDIGRISARAEEPMSAFRNSRTPSAHLRASGGTNQESDCRGARSGASPRERRNLDYVVSQ